MMDLWLRATDLQQNAQRLLQSKTTYAESTHFVTKQSGQPK